jgi:lipopolysaccharide transport system permease protein
VEVAVLREPAETVIEPRGALRPVDWRELWRSRELLCFLVWRDIKVRYRQTLIGAGWALLQPLAQMLIFTLIFSRAAGISTGEVPYPLFALAGLLPWTFFASSANAAGASLINQSALVTKVYFPRLLVPASCIGVALADLGVGLLLLGGAFAWFGWAPTSSLLLLPVALLPLAGVSLGLGLLLASITVRYRDARIAVPFLLQIGLFATPVLYPASLLPASFGWLARANPMAAVIDCFRSVLLGTPIDTAGMLLSWALAAGLLLAGVYRFRQAERCVADVV